MFPLLQQSDVANRWQRSDLTVTRRRRLRPLAPSLLSAVPSNGPTQLDTALADSGLGKHHTQAYPRTKSDTDALTFLRRFRFPTELSRGSRRKLKVASRDVSHNGQNASAGEACPMSCKPTESPACGLFSAPRSPRGRNSGAVAACNPADWSGNQSALRRTTTMDPPGMRYPSLKPRPSH